MQKSFFRAYDMRGIVGSECIIEDMRALTNAIIYYMQSESPVSSIALGRDGRVHSYDIYREIASTLQDAGINVVDFGVCTSPALYFGLHHYPVDGGIMVTASHNGPTYNGLKICKGIRSLLPHQIQKIRVYYEQGKKPLKTNVKGTLKELSLNSYYIAWLVDHFQNLKDFPYRTVFDCGNGVTGVFLPELNYQLNLGAQILFNEIDGTFPHHEADPTILANMEEVRKALPGRLLGIGFDGDGDRLGVMLPNGNLLAADILLALFAREILAIYPRSIIMSDVKTSMVVRDFIEAQGGKHLFCSVGHSLVKHMMKEKKAILAGELSGHIFFDDRYFGFDDGIYTSLRLLEIMLKDPFAFEVVQQSLATSYITQELRIACSEEYKNSIVKELAKHMATDARCIDLDGYRLEWPEGWLLIRASQTQPSISLRAESYNLEMLLTLLEKLKDFLKAYNLEEALDKEIKRLGGVSTA